MRFTPILPLLALTTLIAGCAGGAIAPNYTSQNPDIMRIGNERPADPQVKTEDLGSYCIKVTETWNEQGKTPDGKTLWALDTQRSVVPCN
ncbi:hypothetical protein SAMN05216571_103379 [Onishia taeanensis]|jgi:hypothetical protein|uniref:Lipoprotein n=1 Tax=Onishia taeanensis TaxID=284577 RepID=A0A1G7QRM4_9GAMM|nr:hypothetical protein [Halomonas taeanensis]SDG00529.1 hypothetical protein SAMN05216571_103379 [Halomonas taeanensis]